MAKRDIRVLRIISVLDPAAGGPVESAVSACIAAQRAGINNTFVIPVSAIDHSATAPVRARLSAAGVEVHTFRLVRVAPYYGRRWGLSLELARWLIRHTRQYDLVHIHQAWGLVQVVGLLAAVASRVPSVVTPHESLTTYDVGHTRSYAKKALKSLYLRSASLIVLSSALEAQDTLPSGYRRRSTVIPHPLTSSEGLTTAPRSRMSTEPLVVGYLGRLHHKKNIDVLLRAAARASPDARIRIAGDGEPAQKEVLANLVDELRLTDRVEWLGFVPRTDRAEFFRSIDVLAMPSRYECFGMSAAEAMAAGVATVVSASTGIADLVRTYECGRVVEPTVGAVAGALQELEADRALLAQLGHRGVAAAHAALSMEGYGRRIDGEYKRLLCTRITPTAPADSKTRSWLHR